MLNISVQTTQHVAPHVALDLAQKFNAMSLLRKGDAEYRNSGEVLFVLSRAVVNVTVERHTHTSPLSQDDGELISFVFEICFHGVELAHPLQSFQSKDAWIFRTSSPEMIIGK